MNEKPVYTEINPFREHTSHIIITRKKKLECKGTKQNKVPVKPLSNKKILDVSVHLLILEHQ